MKLKNCHIVCWKNSHYIQFGSIYYWVSTPHTSSCMVLRIFICQELCLYNWSVVSHKVTHCHCICRFQWHEQLFFKLVGIFQNAFPFSYFKYGTNLIKLWSANMSCFYRKLLIKGYYSGDYEEFYILGCDAM